MKNKYLIDFVQDSVLKRLEPRTIELLKTTKTPRHAFVTYQVNKLRFEGQGESVFTTSICTINVEDQPDQRYILNDLLNRGGKYCCHGNFPTHNDVSQVRAEKWKAYKDPEGTNPWDMVAEHCYRQVGQSEEIYKVESKYKAEIERLQGQIEAKNSKNSKKQSLAEELSHES